MGQIPNEEKENGEIDCSAVDCSGDNCQEDEVYIPPGIGECCGHCECKPRSAIDCTIGNKEAIFSPKWRDTECCQKCMLKKLSENICDRVRCASPTCKDNETYVTPDPDAGKCCGSCR